MDTHARTIPEVFRPDWEHGEVADCDDDSFCVWENDGATGRRKSGASGKTATTRVSRCASPSNGRAHSDRNTTSTTESAH
ncbi:peptidase inhibitor family I36 protein [Amycolatopsis sp. NPDC005232]|uniref:peptidase inhibitor family I36 protein n=1 Tax=Amycolatopsis sp. NPDC005232 TaxID=3157027 RepID=UPI0033B7F4FB